MERTGYVENWSVVSQVVVASVIHLYWDQGDPSTHFHWTYPHTRSISQLTNLYRVKILIFIRVQCVLMSNQLKALNRCIFSSVWKLSLSAACHEDVAASTSRCHAGISIARRLATARPKLSGRRSSSTVLSQVYLGLPVLRCQSLGGSPMLAQRAREWSWPVSAWLGSWCKIKLNVHC